MPVLKETEKPEQYPRIVVAALVTLCAVFIGFSQICYYAWGQGLDEPVVTQMLPSDNTLVQVVKLVFCVSLVFSFALTGNIIVRTLQEVFLGDIDACRNP